MSKTVFLLFLSSFISIASFSQRPGGGQGMGNSSNAPAIGVISGKVLDAVSKVPMQYVSVALYSQRDSSISGGSITNVTGDFTISEVKYGRYFIIATFMGYQRDTIKDIRITPNAPNTSLNPINLKTSNKELNEVEVVATRTYVEYKIDRKVVNVGSDISSSGGSAVEALENVPSVNVDIEGNVTLRGSSNFTVLIDGKPSPLNGTQALEQIPVGAIQNIEIITNPSAKYDPDGMSGIVNIILKKDVKMGLNGMIEVSAGNYNNYGINGLLSYRYKKFSFFGGGDYNMRNHPGSGVSELEQYYGDTTFYRDFTTDRSRIRNSYNLKGGFDYFLDDKNTITLEGRYVAGTNENPYIAKTHEYFDPLIISDLYKYSENLSDGENSNYSGNLMWEHKFKNNAEKFITLIDYKNGSSVSNDDQREYFADQEYLASGKIYSGYQTVETDNSQDFLFKFDYTKPHKKENKFEAGAQVRMALDNESYDFSKLDTATNIFVLKDDYSSKMIFNQNIFSAYATYGGIYKEKYGYLFGFRTEHTYRSIESKATTTPHIINRPDFFPTVHFSKKMKKEQQLLLSYSRRIERPGGWNLDPFPTFMSSNMIRIGNPTLQPEYIDNFELSYQKTIKLSNFSIEAYYRNTQNKITSLREVDSNFTYMTFKNLDRDFATGLEGQLNWVINKAINWNVSGSVYYYRLFGSVENSAVDKSSYNFNVKSNIGFKYSQSGRIQLNGFYEGPSVSAQGTSKGMASMSISVRQDFLKKKLSVTVSLRDIFNSGIHGFESYGTNFYSSNVFIRQGRMFNVSMQYKINNYKQDTRRQTNGGGMNGDEGGGEF